MIHPSVMDNNCSIYYPELGSEELLPGHGFSVGVQCDLHLRYMTLCQGHGTPLDHRQQLCEIFIIKIHHGSEDLWPGHGFSVFVHCDLDIRDMSLVSGHAQ